MTEKRKRGRPKLNIDPTEVQKLAKLGCKIPEIADFFDCSVSHIEKTFKKEMAAGKAELKISLRRAQLQLALGGNATMLIWLGKQVLSQSEQGSFEADDLVDDINFERDDNE